MKEYLLFFNNRYCILDIDLAKIFKIDELPFKIHIFKNKLPQDCYFKLTSEDYQKILSERAQISNIQNLEEKESKIEVINFKVKNLSPYVLTREGLLCILILLRKKEDSDKLIDLIQLMNTPDNSDALKLEQIMAVLDNHSQIIKKLLKEKKIIKRKRKIGLQNHIK